MSYNNSTEIFRLVGTYSKDTDSLLNFLTKYVCPGNTIITNQWAGYEWLNNPQSGYSHISFHHGNGSFGSGLQSTSHIEAIWNIIKDKIKNNYYIIPNKNLFDQRNGI